MKTFKSQINPEYSGSAYRVSKYGSGAGYYFHLTRDKDRGFSVHDMKEAGQAAVVDELKPQLKKEWQS